MRFSRFLLAIAALFVATSSAFAPALRAQDQKPIAIVSFASLDRLIKDTTYILRACNVPEFAGIASSMSQHYTQGLDQTKPLGVAISLDGQMPVGVLFFPLTDRDKFFSSLASIGIEPDDLGDGLFEIDANGQTLFAKDANGWLYIAQSEEAISAVPKDPSTLLGDLPSKYDIAIKANIQALPQDLRDMATAQMRMGFENTLNQGEQTEEELEMTRKAGEAQIAQIEELMRDTEQVFFGWAIDSAAQKTHFDAAAQFLPGTKFAVQADSMSDLKSDFTALKLPGSSVNFRATSTVTDETDKEVAKQNVRNSMAQAKRGLEDANIGDSSQQLLIDLMSSIEKLFADTIDEGTFDGASSVSVADDNLRILVGGRVADGQAIAAELKKLVKGLPNSQYNPKAEFGYETYQGVTLHRLSIPVKIADPNAKRIFGEELKLTVGTADKSFLVSLDSSGDGSLKEAIDRMATAKAIKSVPMTGVIEFTALLEFAQTVVPNPILDNAIETIKDYAGKDKIEVVGSVYPRGGIYRISIEEGVLRIIGASAKSGMAGGRGF